MWVLELLLYHPILIVSALGLGIFSSGGSNVIKAYITGIIFEVIIFLTFCMFGLFHSNMAQYFPHGITYNTPYGVQTFGNYWTEDDPLNHVGSHYSYDIVNNTNETLHSVNLTMKVWECEKPITVRPGSYLPKDNICVGSEDSVDVVMTKYEGIIKPHSTVTVTGSFYSSSPWNRSHGKYPYTYWSVSPYAADTGYLMGFHIPEPKEEDPTPEILK